MKISKRHIAKSLTWRLIGTLDTLLVAWLISNDLSEGLSISGITTLTKLLWYYMHERLWFNSSIIDSNKRHIVKTFSWRGIGTLDTILFGWLITGNSLTGFKIGGIEMISKMLLYYAHERLWYRTNYGLDHPNRLKQIDKQKK